MLYFFLFEVLVGLKVLSVSSPTNLNPTSAPTPTILLSRIDVLSIKKEYKVGEVVPISILVNTAGRKTDGTDLILYFDNRILEATNGAIKKGLVYGEYPVTEVDSKNGVIKISGVSKIGQDGFSGSGILANLSLIARGVGKTVLKVDYTAGRTTDSNVVETKSAKDTLGQVNNLDLTRV